MEIKRTVDIKQPVEDVFKFIANPANSAKWITGVAQNEKATEGPVRKGTTGTQTRFILGRRLAARWKIVEFEPNRRIAMEIISGPLKGVRVAESTDLLDPAGPVTRVTVTLEGEPAGILKAYRLARPLVNRAYTRQVDADLQNLKELLEGGG